MPSISTTVYPSPAYVRVETNWADVPSAVWIVVNRIDCVTGVSTPLRPYVSYYGDGLALSCGFGLFWDTEPPLDTCFYYCATGLDASGNTVTTATTPVYSDTFTRTVVDGWGTADTGQTYTLAGGTVPGDFDVNGSQGTITISSNNATRSATVVGLNVPDGNLYGYYKHPVVPTGANHEAGIRVRYVDANNFCDLRLFINTGGTVTAVVRQFVGGVESNVSSFVTVKNAGGANVATTDPLNWRLDYWGSNLSAKVWLATDPEPTAYTATTTVSFYNSGTVQVYDTIPVGSTNATPYATIWDSLRLVDPCTTTTAVSSCTGSMTVPSGNMFRYGDPMRPCNDVLLLNEYNQDPPCVPTQGIFFANMGEETFVANSGTFTPVNADTPIGVNRTRFKSSSTLTVVTRTFMDRDALRTLHAPGGVTYLRTPAVYGVTDRYMLADDVTELRPVSDHKIQPRAVTIPHVIQARPWGPTQGVCGTRVQDLCDRYPTLAALEASGLTWADLLRGVASPDTPTAAAQRTWNDVNSTYASWNAVQAGNSSWADLLDGP